MPSTQLVVDVVVTARNCAASLAETLRAIPARICRSTIVVDRASDDGTAQVADDAGAIVLREPTSGYGIACQRALAHLEALPKSPDIVVFINGDGANAPSDIPALLGPMLNDNAELVLGVRRVSRTSVGLHTRVVLGLIRTIYGHQYSDFSSFRAIRFPAAIAMGLADPGEGWHAEMQVKAIKLGLHIAEVPVSYRPIPKPHRKRLAKAGRLLFQIIRHATTR